MWNNLKKILSRKNNPEQAIQEARGYLREQLATYSRSLESLQQQEKVIQQQENSLLERVRTLTTQAKKAARQKQSSEAKSLLRQRALSEASLSRVEKMRHSLALLRGKTQEQYEFIQLKITELQAQSALLRARNVQNLTPEIEALLRQCEIPEINLDEEIAQMEASYDSDFTGQTPDEATLEAELAELTLPEDPQVYTPPSGSVQNQKRLYDDFFEDKAAPPSKPKKKSSSEDDFSDFFKD
jgi:hypothetical protein